MAPRAVLAGLALAWSGCSPFGGNGAFVCSTDQQCNSGVCEPDGYCAFADPSCVPTGFRYGDLSGPEANKCVGGSNPMIDAGRDAFMYLDARPDGPPGESCYGTGLVTACFQNPPTGNTTLPGDINTDDANMCSKLVLNTAASGWCVIAGQTIQVAAGGTKAHGTKPLVLVATSAITVVGTLDVASHQGGQTGAGANPSGGCTAGTVPGASGGGAGGSFGGLGGDGGDPNKGTPGPTSAFSLRGGCRGQDGNAGGTTAVGGNGGGAVYLIAPGSITVAGAIDASGEGGTVGTPANAGGSGGGAGGLIGLESPTVTVTGVVYANGGGASSGTGGTTAGSSGQDPVGIAPAPGGNGPTTHGGPGGNGAAGATPAGGPGTAGNTGGGGGGGGGGAGIIKVVPTQTLGGMVSPPPS